MDILLTGRRMDAAEAAHYGLVNYVVPHGGTLARATEIARVIAGGAPLSVQAIKEAVRGMETMSVQEAFQVVHDRTMPVYAKMLHSDDHEEGPRAFAEGRDPVWKGR
jgi:crotonobetainyl-CoA hydratase